MSTILKRACAALLMAFMASTAFAGWLAKQHEKYGSKITPNSANVVRQLTKPVEKENLRAAAQDPVWGAGQVIKGGAMASLPRSQTTPSKMARWEQTSDDMMGTTLSRGQSTMFTKSSTISTTPTSQAVTSTPPPSQRFPETGPAERKQIGVPKRTPTFVTDNGRKSTMPIDCRKRGQLQESYCQ